jgi:uncharacterized protein (DUF2141 family)
MQHLITNICLVILFLFCASYLQNNDGNNISVTISNLSSDQGKVFVGLYDSDKHFLIKTYRGIISKIDNNSCKVVFKNIPDGIYAISLFHDENDNGKMDKGLWGIPKEDHGCSNNAKSAMGPPKWKDAKFELKGKSINQHIKL